ncbi:MAG: hypothetical protein ACJ762_05375 [Solirubrobacteraceae bacterium]
MSALAGLRAQPGRMARALRDRRENLLAQRQLPALAGPAQDALVARLREDMRTLEAGGAAVESPWWADVRRRLVGNVLHDDPRRFLTWPEIRETMFVDAIEPYVPVEYAALRADAGWSTRWRTAIEEDPSGCPRRWPRDRATSANLVHHAYHLMRFEAVAGPLADIAQVVEYGGGYGSFARLARRTGFTGGFHIHDFAELGALQRYFLGSVAALREDPALAADITFGTAQSEVPPAGPGGKLFVAMWSLSETPVVEREPWIDAMRDCSHVFLAFQHEFEGADNRVWFDELRERVTLRWHAVELDHVPGGHSYLIGVPA